MPKNIPPAGVKEFSIKAQLLANGVGELLLYGDISDERWWEDEQCVIPKEVDDEIKKIGSVSQLNVRINSYGGSVFAGSAIATMIDRVKAKGCKVTTYVDGIAASMGSVISMVGDDIVMAENAMMMIHKPLTRAWGNADDMQKVVEMLNKVETAMITLYMRHFTGTEDELKQMLADETWLTGKEAKEYGLCTILEGSANIAASAKGFCFNGLPVPIDVLEKAKSKIQPNSKGGENEMFLNEETQKQLEACFGTLTGVDVKSVVLTQNADDTYAVKAEEILPPPTVFLTAEQVKAKTGKDMTADDVLGMFDTVAALEKEISDYKSQNPEDKAKVAAYDKLFSDSKAEALKNGIKAKGDKFDNERWDKLLAGMSLDDIKAQSDEWLDEGKKALHAGKRISSPATGEAKNTVPDEAYKL